MPKRIQETAARLLAEATASPGRFKVRIISSGTGSSGHYPAATIRDAVERKIWHKGQHVYMDHPSASEEGDRPERTLRDLVGVLDEDAVYDDAAEAAEAVVKVYSPYRPLLTEMADDIGLSIRAWAESSMGEVNGEAMPIITRLTEGMSVDFVTHAGRGGRVLEVLESATRIDSIDRVAEAATQDRREQLQKAIRDTYPSDDHYTWIRDYDPEKGLVWFERAEKTWQQSYTVADDDLSVSLTGERIEVRPVTQYQPVNPSAGQVGESSPQPMEAIMEITEAQYAELTANANRATALEAERDSAIQRAEAAEADARTRAREAYDAQVGAALAASDLPAPARDRALTALTLAEGADVPIDATAAIEAAIQAEADYAAQLVANQPAARGMGFGGGPVGESRTRTHDAWGKPLTTKEA